MEEKNILQTNNKAPNREPDELYDMAVITKQALTSELTDEGIGMPDIEAEMKRVYEAARPTRSNRFRHIAASVAAFLVIGAIAIAAVQITRYYRQQPPQTSAPVIEQKSDTIISPPPVEEDADSVEVLYDNATLYDMLTDIAQHYGMKAEFANEQLKGIRLYYYFNKTKSVDKAIRDLNHFNKMSITRDEKTIFVNVKSKQ